METFLINKGSKGMPIVWLEGGKAVRCLSPHPKHFLIIIIFVNLKTEHAFICIQTHRSQLDF